MANHLSPEIGDGKKFRWLTDNPTQRRSADRVIDRLTREEVILLLKSIAINEQINKEEQISGNQQA